MSSEKLIFLIILGLCATPFVFMLLDIVTDSKWFCTTLGWHKTPKKVKKRGITLYGKCPRCSKTIIEDSQGNWF